MQKVAAQTPKHIYTCTMMTSFNQQNPTFILKGNYEISLHIKDYNLKYKNDTHLFHYEVIQELLIQSKKKRTHKLKLISSSSTGLFSLSKIGTAM